MADDLITVVTVCYNAENDIESTMLSVLNQTYTNLEYIIIDGASKDSTLQIINRVSSQYPNRRIIKVSEPDKGIYDAMNKAIDMATGEWINFMNAGDCFSCNNTLNDVFKSHVSEDFSVIFGNSKFIDSVFGRQEVVISSTEKLGQYMPNCHQAAFVRTKELKANNFRIDYKVISDFIFFYNIKKSGKHFLLIDDIIVNYDVNGLSSDNQKVTKEYIRFLLSQCDFNFIRLCLRYTKHYIVPKLLNRIK